MNDEQLLRYSPQIMLPQIDVAGQQRLQRARVLIIGLGGLGSPVALYLAAAGVGTLVLVDDDHIAQSNLQRQILHGVADLGRRKTDSAIDTLRRINPDASYLPINKRLEGEELAAQVRTTDLVIDCSDNFATRFLLNAVAVAERRPLVSGAAIRFEGQVTVFLNEGDSPCYRCLYCEMGEEEQRCSENGVLAPLVGIIGATQATEAIKVILNIGNPLGGRLLVLDALIMEWRSLRLRKDPACPVCSDRQACGE